MLESRGIVWISNACISGFQQWQKTKQKKQQQQQTNKTNNNNKQKIKMNYIKKDMLEWDADSKLMIIYH